jgi:hypothetical protein
MVYQHTINDGWMVFKRYRHDELHSHEPMTYQIHIYPLAEQPLSDRLTKLLDILIFQRVI